MRVGYVYCKGCGFGVVCCKLMYGDSVNCTSSYAGSRTSPLECMIDLFFCQHTCTSLCGWILMHMAMYQAVHATSAYNFMKSLTGSTFFVQ